MKLTPIALLALLVVGLSLPGCSQSKPPKTPEPPRVDVAVAIQKKIQSYTDFSGTLASVEVVEVRARVEGYLLPVKEYTSKFVADVAAHEQSVAEYRKAVAEYQKARAENKPLPTAPILPRAPRSPDGLPIKAQEDFEVRAEDGQGGAGSIVEKGALLFVIDPEPFDVALDAAIATRTQSQAQLDLAQANFTRYEGLVAQEAVTAEEYQKHKASRDVAAGQVAADSAAIRDAEINLSHTIMRAPFTGRVDRRYVDPGNLVGAEEKTLLTTVRREDRMHVYFDVSEKVILELLEWRRTKDRRDRYEVSLKLEDETDFVHQGELDYLENRVDPETGTALIRGEFSNEGGYLYDGLNVMVRVPGEPIPDAVLVYESALGTDLGGKYLMVLGENKEGVVVANKTPVELGVQQGEMREILHGIKSGEEYVYRGLQRVRDLSPVTVDERIDPSKLPATQPEQPAGSMTLPQATDQGTDPTRPSATQSGQQPTGVATPAPSAVRN